MYMLFMFEFVVRVDHDVVQVGYIEIVKVVEEYIIHVLLVSGRPVCKSEQDYFVLVTTISSPECSKVL